jgi:PAS domain S-box-containing protein
MRVSAKNSFRSQFRDPISFSLDENSADLEFQKNLVDKILNSVGDAIMVIDPRTNKIIRANEAASKRLKLEKKNIIGKTCYEVTHHRSNICTSPNDVCPVQEMLMTQKPVLVEHQYFDAESHRIDVEVSVHPIKDRNGKIIQIVHIERDITERKNQEREEKAKSDEIQGIFDGITDLLFVIDKNRIITKINKATCDVFKKKPEELLGRHCYEVVHGTNCPWNDCPARKTFKTKQTVTEEINDVNLGIPLLVTTSPILDQDGEVTQIIHIAKDISKMKLAEMELHIAANLFATASDSILVHDLDGKIVYFNDAAYTSRGYTLNEFQALCIQDLELPGNPKFFETRMADLLNKGEATFESINLRKDKKTVPVEIHAQIIESDGRKLILSIARDISERKAAEEKLAESQEKYETSFELSMDALMLLDEKSFLDCNIETLRLFRFKSVEEFIKNHPADLSPIFQPDGSSSLESARSHIKKALWSGKDAFFWRHKRADGTTFPADVLLSRITLKNQVILQATVRDITQKKEAEEKLEQAEEKHRTLLNAANVLVQSVDAEGKFVFVNDQWKTTLGFTDSELDKVYLKDVVRKDHLQFCTNVFKQVMNGLYIRDVETVFVAKDGREIIVSGNACPIFKNGVFVSTVAFFVDVTEKKKNEAKIKENNREIELMVEKLRVIGSLTRHDVRNKLSIITGYAYLLKKKHPQDADIVAGLDKMEQAVRETVRIFDFAKLYEQLGAEELVYVNVEDKLNEAVSLHSGSFPRIVNECHGLMLLADSFLRQLFYNFIDNTRKYGEKTTTAKVYYQKSDENYLKLIYEDDGVGVSFENKPFLFKEGFSTGGSSGFGLFLSKKMMDVYGWVIEENGEPGKGAKFTITIPKQNQNGKDNYRFVN